MDAGGKGSSLIGDARIEGDDDDDDEHAPMRPRHASARAAVPAAVQPAVLTRPTALQLQHERELAMELDRAWRAEAEVAKQAASKTTAEAAVTTVDGKAEAAVTTVDGKAEAATAAPREAAPVEVAMAGAISEGSPGRGPTGPPPEPPPRSRDRIEIGSSSRDRASPALVVMAVAPPPWPGGGGSAFSPAPWPKPPGVPHLARAAVLEELETKLSLTKLSRLQMVGAIAEAAAEEEGRAMVEAQGMAMEAVAARGGLASEAPGSSVSSEAPGTTEIAYEWLGREMARATKDSGERDEERVRITSQIEDSGLKSVGDIMTVKEGVQLRVSHVDKDKKALVATTSFARGKRRHGCASAAGASPCRSPLATVAEQAEEPSLAEESSASLVASEEEQQQEASSPSPSQTQRQLTLVKPRTVAAEAARVAAGCGMATPLSWLGFELVQSAPGIVAVAEVAAGSAAEEAGLCVGERLYALDGKRVRTTAEAAILLDDLSGAIAMIVSPLTSWQPMRPPVPSDVPLCKQSWPTTPIADGVDVHKNTSIAIDPSRIDVHNAAANLQRVRSTKAHAAAAPPIPSVSSGLKRTSEADPTALATALEGDATRRQHIGAGGEPSISTSIAAPAPSSSSSSSSSRSVFPATWLPWSRAEASRGEKRGPKPSLVMAVSSASSASVQLSRGSKPSLVVAHANADLRPQSPPMSTAESPPPPEMEPAWLVDAIVPVEHTRSSAVPMGHTRSSADAPASALSSRAAEMLDEQTEESVTTTVDGWVYNHAPGERWTEAELAEQAGELDETDEAELAELAAPKEKPKEAAVTPADRKAEAATAAPRGAAARVERTMTSVVVAEARAAVQEELETTLHQAATFGAVAARGGPASEAPGTTEIAYEWLGREEARVDSTTPSPPLLGRRPSTPVAE
jgi:hypothetical protein